MFSTIIKKCMTNLQHTVRNYIKLRNTVEVEVGFYEPSRDQQKKFIKREIHKNRRN